MGLVVEHISKSFAQFQAIKDLSMEVKEGSLFGFLGANGAGKTTTMRISLWYIDVWTKAKLETTGEASAMSNVTLINGQL